jgi:hypothetical protein
MSFLAYLQQISNSSKLCHTKKCQFFWIFNCCSRKSLRHRRLKFIIITNFCQGYKLLKFHWNPKGLCCESYWFHIANQINVSSRKGWIKSSWHGPQQVSQILIRGWNVAAVGIIVQCLVMFPTLCRIWGFHGGDYEECRLLECGAV